ncbi:MAG TPA: hypothetical protein VGN13_12610 [Solirubrobacteraceae bacterium]|jgi:hypothetical protein
MTRVTLGVVVLASAGLLLAGCGGGATSAGVAHLSSSAGGSPASGAATSSTSESRGSTQQKLVAYSKCMRSHGVPGFPEPTEGRPLIRVGGPGAANPKSAQFQAAQKTCEKLLPNGGAPSPAVQAKLQEGALKFSRCMRTHGVPGFPDPSTSTGGVELRIKSSGAGKIDPSSPQFKAAQTACQSDLPRLPDVKGGPGGGEVSSSGGPGASGQNSGSGNAVAVP